VEGKPGAAVPDLLGCTAAASTTDEVLLRTVDALLLWAEDALADGAIILWRGWLELRVAQSPG
jgi:predicted RNase H-like HicB family nuclease